MQIIFKQGFVKPHGILVFAVTFFLVVIKLYGQTIFSSANCGDFPTTMVLIKEETVQSNQFLSNLKWPSEEQVGRLRVEAVKGSRIELAARQNINKVFRQEYIPSDIVRRFIPLRDYISAEGAHVGEGCDALLARYECGEFLFQLIITSSNARIVIREEVPYVRINDQEKLKLVRDMIAEFFKESNILLKSTGNIMLCNDASLRGEMPNRIQRIRDAMEQSGERVHWYQTMRWWTNGELVCFWVCFNPGSSIGCTDQKDWFSLELSHKKGLRRKGEKLTEEMVGEVLGLRRTD